MVFNDRIVKLECFMVEPNQIQPSKKTYKDIYFGGRSFFNLTGPFYVTFHEKNKRNRYIPKIMVHCEKDMVQIWRALHL